MTINCLKTALAFSILRLIAPSFRTPKQWDKRFGETDEDDRFRDSLQETTNGRYILGGASPMKHFIAILSVFIFLSSQTFSQTTASIDWQKTLGGTGYDYGYSIQQTTDRGYIVSGFAESNDGDITGNHGSFDYWIVKLDTSGNKLWEKAFGGSATDYGSSIQQTTDGGYVVVGYTESNDGDITGNHGVADYWIVKLDSTGNKLWQKTLGGTNDDRAFSIQQTIDGGYIVAGGTTSNDGDVTGNHGGYDSWIVKLDANGNKLWQKTLGGTGYDYGNSLRQTTDGGYVIGATTESNDGDVTGNHGGLDYWIIKLDINGNKLWQKTLGGTGTDQLYSIQQTTDGGYIVAGGTTSNDGDVTGNHGSIDYWIVKLDANGNKLWQKTLGGTDEDNAQSIQQTGDGGYIVAGFTGSNDGDVTGNHGFRDYWIVKLDSKGNISWQKAVGGTGQDEATSIRPTTDGDYIVAGGADSNNGDVTGNHGSFDYWIIKLTATCTPFLPTISITATPNTSVCSGTTVTFTATANGGASPVYQWKNNKINVGANKNIYVDSTLKDGDSIYCVLTSNDPCASKPTVKSNGIKMIVNKLVTPKISIVADSSTSICAGDKVRFVASIKNGGTTPVYQWKKNGINVGTNSKTYVDKKLKNGDSIYCILTSNAACVTKPTVNSNGITMVVNNCVSLGGSDFQASATKKNESTEFLLTATPNPFKHSIELTVTSSVASSATVLVTTMTGQRLFIRAVLVSAGTTVIPITSAGWSAGTYYVKVSTNSTIKTCKIIKE